MLWRHVPLIAVVVTSVAAIWIGVTRLHLDPRHFRIAGLRVLDCISTAMLFFGANVLGSITLVAASRVVGAQPLSSYASSDLVLVIVSLLQGLAFRLWRDTGRDAR